MKDKIIPTLVILMFCVGIAFTMTRSAEKHVYLPTEIKSPSNYIELAKQLQSFNGRLYLHVAGTGGDYEGVIYIINSMRHIEDVTVIVDGTVVSGHATIALSRDKVQIAENGFFMVHLLSGTNMEEWYCRGVTGLNRGLNAKQKCIENTKNLVRIYNEETIQIFSKVLTKKEIKRLRQGHDIYISNREMIKRIKNGQPRN